MDIETMEKVSEVWAKQFPDNFIIANREDIVKDIKIIKEREFWK